MCNAARALRHPVLMSFCPGKYTPRECYDPVPAVESTEFDHFSLVNRGKRSTDRI